MAESFFMALHSVMLAARSEPFDRELYHACQRQSLFLAYQAVDPDSDSDLSVASISVV